ncbi:MAG: hypothetical protein JST40_05740 [Armatimonadetes bacterium]|nr:hypothetical protein [Armatimonadota bacterium]
MLRYVALLGLAEIALAILIFAIPMLLARTRRVKHITVAVFLIPTTFLLAFHVGSLVKYLEFSQSADVKDFIFQLGGALILYGLLTVVPLSWGTGCGWRIEYLRRDQWVDEDNPNVGRFMWGLLVSEVLVMIVGWISSGPIYLGD